MARVILKDPKEPSVKKAIVLEKKTRPLLARFFKLSIYLNIWLLKLVVYLLNKPFFDALFAKILNNIKQLM